MSAPRSHVLFSPSAAGTLKQALRQMAAPDEVHCLFDDFSFGPIATATTDGRPRWIEDNLGIEGWGEVTERTPSFLTSCSTMASATVWVSRKDARSYAGFLWWLSQVEINSISIVDNPRVSVIGPDEMICLMDQSEPLTSNELEDYRATWDDLTIQDAPLRIIGECNLISAGIDYFDDTLFQNVTAEWRKMARVVAGVLTEFHEANIYQTGDLVLASRLADLARSGRLEWRGDLSIMRDCELRLPTA